VRMRGSVFFRDADRAMRPVFERLEELEIAPELGTEIKQQLHDKSPVLARIIRRAEELRKEWSASPLDTEKTVSLVRFGRRRYAVRSSS